MSTTTKMQKAAGRAMRMGDGAARSAAARDLGGQSAGGLALARAMTPEERSEAGRRASGPGGLTVGFRRGWRRPLVHYDAGHHAVVHHLKACGWSVTDLAQVGMGCPDLLIGRRGVTYLAEIKASAEDRSEER